MGEQHFTISKGFASYLVNLDTSGITVFPLITNFQHDATVTIADSLQTIGNSQLLRARPKDRVKFLCEYFVAKGWSIVGCDE